MEKVGDSQSSSEPVVPTSNEMMKRQKRVLKVEAESSEICVEKIKGALEKLRERGDIETWREDIDWTVMVFGYFDPEKLRVELQNEAGDEIKSITHLPELKGKLLRLQGDSGKIPQMSVPEVANTRMEVLKHTEIEEDHATNNSRRVWYLIEKFGRVGKKQFGRVGKKPKMGDARGSGFPNNCTKILNHNENTMESSKSGR